MESNMEIPYCKEVEIMSSTISENVKVVVATFG
jgi:hypothetical protein